MQSTTPKKDESVKAGLQIKSSHIPETVEELHDLFLPRKKEQPDDYEKSAKKKLVPLTNDHKKK